MFAPNLYAIRAAAAADEFALRRLAELDQQSPLSGRILVGEIADRPAAALSLDERRMVSDPSVNTGLLRTHLRLRASGIEAHRRTPNLRDRLRDAFRRPRRDEEQAAA
jgi:hypothetical protein